MSGVARDTIRRVARTAEYFIVGQMAKEMPPADRLFVLYEMSGPRSAHPLIKKARRDHPQGRCIDEYVMVVVTRGQLEALVDSPKWMADTLDRSAELLPNEARCIVLSEDSPHPAILKLSAHTVNRPGSPVIVDR